MQSLTERIERIEVRNLRVEADKAWEVSSMRIFIIFIITYVVAAVWLLSIHDTRPLLKAFVPAAGWLLSQWSLPFAKKWWTRRYTQNKTV